jgi:predicted nucleotidyltransferase component of viral defense system
MYEYIKSLLAEKESTTDVFKRNAVKEYLQVLTLTFLYSHKMYRNMVFYGGSSLRHCYGLPRLSEDLDFVDTEKAISIDNLATDLMSFFKGKYGIAITSKVQKFRCILKFPILHALNLAKSTESNFLFLKIEVYRIFDFCKEYRVEIKPVFKFGESVLVKTFDLPTLMATKLRAILYRKWERTTKNGKILAAVKGRDYYDLMWYFEQDVKPNMKCIEGIASMIELYKKLLKIISSVDSQSIKYDLEGLLEDPAFVEVLKDNIKEILTSSIARRMKQKP